ncbi:hypothetical protein CC86DRAFT_386516 [Ophiobolus disseminans]|uniref:Uncharacterized protein n=1 Tax=Ophiobolus disseminans TaxID=1469910 RepID=A0A6A6ZKJ5_9PLEO|nr:hypothetical protein CC86DRAFT_386516 [Ophiobolus disseminans]
MPLKRAPALLSPPPTSCHNPLFVLSSESELPAKSDKEPLAATQTAAAAQAYDLADREDEDLLDKVNPLLEIEEEIEEEIGSPTAVVLEERATLDCLRQASEELKDKPILRVR